MPLYLCISHLEQYYKYDLKNNSFQLAWLLDHEILIKINILLTECDWCKLGMPTFT